MIKRLLIVVLVFTTAIISAQRNSSSPYSFFGIGEDFKPKTVEQSSMGGIGVAMKDINHLNFINPAAYADLRYATYGLGGMTTFLTLKENDASQSGNSSSLRYIGLAFPVGKKAGLSLGLQPISSVGYSLLSRSEDASLITRYTGEGGINKLYASYGIYAFEGFSIGIEAGYLFGTLENNIINQNSGDFLATKYNEETTVRGSEFTLGAQYKTDLSNNLELSTGIAVKLPNDLKERGTKTLYSLAFGQSGQEAPVDTLYTRSLIKSVKNPLKTTMGFGLGKTNKWYVGLNSEFQTAIQNSEASGQNGYKYGNAYRTSLGGFYIPKANSISSYWDRVTYRAGVRFENTGLLVNGNPTGGNNFTPIKDFGINVGLGLPLPRQISNLNLGLEYGQKGTANNNLIKENYFNVRLSLSLNGLNWFQKRKID